MNRKIILGIISIIVVILFIGIIVLLNYHSDNVEKNNIINDTNENEEKYYENTPIIETINNNSNLPLQYLSKYDETNSNLQNYEKINNFMSINFQNDDIAFSYYGYPNDESEKYLGSISLLTNKYNILGITIGDDIEQAVAKFQEYGFKLNSSDIYSANLTYGDFTIDISEDLETEQENHKIGTIKLYAESEYLGNRVY